MSLWICRFARGSGLRRLGGGRKERLARQFCNQSVATQKARIGLVGLGYNGRYVYEQITSRPELGLEVAFAHQLAAERLAGLPHEAARSGRPGRVEGWRGTP